MSPKRKNGQKVSAYASSSGADHSGMLKGFESGPNASQKRSLTRW